MIKSYKELPVGRYIEMLRRTEEVEDELQKQVCIVAGLSGLTEDEVLDLPIQDYTRMAADAAFLSEPCPEGQMRRLATYRIGDFVLVPVKDFRKITTAQYIDFQSYAKDAEHNIVEMLSIFLVPDGCRYNEGYDIAEVQRAIADNLSVADALGLAAFFLTRYVESIKASLGFSRKALRHLPRGARKEAARRELERLTASMRNGDGSPM